MTNSSGVEQGLERKEKGPLTRRSLLVGGTAMVAVVGWIADKIACRSIKVYERFNFARH
jgi:hypothetical protein